MKMRYALSVSGLAASLVLAPAPAAAQQPKIGTISIQQAIIGTRDGQRAAAELQTKADPKQKVLQGKQAEIRGLTEQLQKGANTLSVDQRERLQRDIDAKTRLLNRDAEDAEAEIQQEQNRLLGEISQKMQVVIDKYARDNGYSVILDISQQTSPIIYASETSSVTADVIALYDKNAAAPTPAAGAPAAAPAGAKPAMTPGTPAATKPAPGTPATPAPAKRQPGAVK